jgi:hypothetical protein
MRLESEAQHVEAGTFRLPHRPATNTTATSTNTSTNASTSTSSGSGSSTGRGDRAEHEDR